MNRPGTPLPRASEMALAPMPHGLVQPDTARGGITPKLDTEAALAPGRGLASLGTALERTGGALGELRQKQLQAIGIRHEADADMMMSDAEDAIAAETAGQPDETKWGGIAAAHIAKLRERIAAMPLSRATAEAVTGKMDRWELHRKEQMDIASARHSISRARGAIVGKADAAIARGDVGTLRRTLQGGVSGGYFSGEDARQREEEGVQTIRAAQEAELRRQFYALASGNPGEFKKQYGTRPEGMDEEAYRYGMKLANTAEQQQQAAKHQSELEAAVSPEIRAMRDNAQRVQERSDTGLADVQLIKRVRDNADDPAHRWWREEYADINDETARELVRLYATSAASAAAGDAGGDGLGYYKQVCAWMYDTLPEPYRRGRVAELDQQAGLKPGPVEPRKMDVVDAALRALRVVAPPLKTAADAYAFARQFAPTAQMIRDLRVKFADTKATVGEVLEQAAQWMPPDQVAGVLDNLGKASAAAGAGGGEAAGPRNRNQNSK